MAGVNEVFSASAPATGDVLDQYRTKMDRRATDAARSRFNEFFSDQQDLVENWGGNAALREDALRGGLRPVYPELWLADMKAAAELGKLVFRAGSKTLAPAYRAASDYLERQAKRTVLVNGRTVPASKAGFVGFDPANIPASQVKRIQVLKKAAEDAKSAALPASGKIAAAEAELEAAFSRRIPTMAEFKPAYYTDPDVAEMTMSELKSFLLKPDKAGATKAARSFAQVRREWGAKLDLVRKAEADYQAALDRAQSFFGYQAPDFSKGLGAKVLKGMKKAGSVAVDAVNAMAGPGFKTATGARRGLAPVVSWALRGLGRVAMLGGRSEGAVGQFLTNLTSSGKVAILLDAMAAAGIYKGTRDSNARKAENLRKNEEQSRKLSEAEADSGKTEVAPVVPSLETVSKEVRRRYPGRTVKDLRASEEGQAILQGLLEELSARGASSTGGGNGR